MNPFQYASASTPEEAISLIGKNGRYLGGGIDLLGEMKDYIVSPDVLVDVKSIVVPAASDEAQVPVGSTGSTGQSSHYLSGNTTVAAIAADTTIQSSFPGLSEAASEVGSPQIRNVATLAGNLLQHSRCWYYRQPDITCLKRGGSICYGKEGENKYLSLFSGCSCLSPVVSNLAIILTALDATVWVHTGQILPAMTMHGLYQDAWSDPLTHNLRNPRDFLVGVTVPLKRTRSAYRQVSEKSEFDWALVSCAAAANVTNGVVSDARIVLGAVAPIPYMVDEANDFLDGRMMTDENASHAADLILADAKPLAHNGYKVPIAHALIRRTLLALNP
jgi:xanthine dehydrogenase YagS FAD-binding subunit